MLLASGFSQSLPRIIQFQEAEVDIRLDGFIDEPVWQRIPAIDGMKITDPDTLEDAEYKTEIRFFYTREASTLGL